jgi:signal transduction histidine kinase
MAREIHDTLAQGLVATSVQLQLAKKHIADPATPLGRHLDTAQQLVRGSLEEARGSIWNMRSQILENSSLDQALEGILRQLTDGTEIQVRFAVTGHARRLAPAIENNLLRIGQEAIGNAVKHAHAKNISVALDFKSDEAGLTIRDDGNGFDPAHLPLGSHFGMIGQRERTAQMGGRLEVNSSPGQGTGVEVRIPIYD